ncbi:MAG: response regulator [Candidatus Zixiibacteriota bacterium]
MNQDTTTRTGTVLVIDDEQAVTGVIKAILTKEGYQVHIANNGQSGVRLAADVKPDLIILDITMPDLDGYTTAELIKNTPGLANTPIIYLTGRTADEDGGRAFASGGASFVRKPFTGKQLSDLVKLAMQSIS